MGDILLPGYEHQIVTGAGLSIGPGRPKFCAHTTETGRGSLQFLINHWFQNWGSGLPHFIIEGKRCVQLLPLTVGAYTLENKPGGADTNRSGPCVQVEVVSFAAEDWDDDTYETLARLLADVHRAGHVFDLTTPHRFYGANEGIVLASYASPIRLSGAEWDAFNSWTDHAHAPENAHWDIGKKDGGRISRRANEIRFGTTPPAPTEDGIMITEQQFTKAMQELGDRIVGACAPKPQDDGMWMGTFAAENAVYIVFPTGQMAHVPGSTNPDPAQAKIENDAQIARLEAMGWDNRGVQDAALMGRPIVPFRIVFDD